MEGELAATALGNIYTFGPTFRAENSNTPRHLAEFWMIEPEMAFYDIRDNQDLAEDFLKLPGAVRAGVQSRRHRVPEPKTYDDQLIPRLQMVVDHPFERLTYTTAAIEILKTRAKVRVPR